jgi:prepilin-type N-terminal cleavage/methylation domain-containing protein
MRMASLVAAPIKHGPKPVFAYAFGWIHTVATSDTMSSRLQGFTLFEFTCVLAIVAILSSFALPSYQQSQQRSQRTLAKLTLVKTAHWLERQANMLGSYPSYLPDAVWQTPELRYRLALQSGENAYVLTALACRCANRRCMRQFDTELVRRKGVQNANLMANQCWGR